MKNRPGARHRWRDEQPVIVSMKRCEQQHDQADLKRCP